MFHRCRTTLNIDLVVHGRGDNFGGFVQSIHTVQIPQLMFRLDTLRVKAGPVSKELEICLRWDPVLCSVDGDEDTWRGGAVCDPLTVLHYSGPIMGLELSFDFSSMYPSIMCALNISPETTESAEAKVGGLCQSSQEGCVRQISMGRRSGTRLS